MAQGDINIAGPRHQAVLTRRPQDRRHQGTSSPVQPRASALLDTRRLRPSDQGTGWATTEQAWCATSRAAEARHGPARGVRGVTPNPGRRGDLVAAARPLGDLLKWPPVPGIPVGTSQRTGFGRLTFPTCSDHDDIDTKPLQPTKAPPPSLPVSCL